MPNWDFPATGPIDLDINLAAGTVTVSAVPTETIEVLLRPRHPGGAADDLMAEVRVDYDTGRLVIGGPKTARLLRGDGNLELNVTVPPGSRCTAETFSADVICVGELGALDVRSGSGDLTAATVTGPIRFNTASGDFRVAQAAGSSTVKTASGDIVLRHAVGVVSAQTASGDIRIRSADTDLTARTASGDVHIDCLSSGEAEVDSVSGDVTVAVAPGTGVYLDLSSLSGDVRSDLDRPEQDGQAELRLRCRTVNGDVYVRRAVPADLS